MRSPKANPEHAAHPKHPAHFPPPQLPQPAAARRKGPASRPWMVVSQSGRSCLEEVGKHSIMRRTGLPARDLRVLDPLLTHPSTILGRERAIVINLDHIKAIIIATEVLIPNFRDPLVGPFLLELQERVSSSNGSPRPVEATAGNNIDRESMPEANGLTRQSVGNAQLHQESMTHDKQGNSPRPTLNIPKVGGTKLLPFEFRALEVCLESACRCLESETLTLEQEAYPALDELTSKISTLNLERVRQIKSRLVAISGRVQKVRDELEHLLDDDMDMAEMYLTEKLVRQPVSEVSSRYDLDTDALGLGAERDEESKKETESTNGSLGDFKPNIEELEMLLEAYFVQIDGTLNKLSTLREYVDDTEDYINIMLDEKQNQLLEMGVMLSTATLVCSAGIAVVGIFGMNIEIDLYSAPFSTFWKTTFGTVGGIVAIYFLAMAWGKKSGLLQ